MTQINIIEILGDFSAHSDGEPVRAGDREPSEDHQPSN